MPRCARRGPLISLNGAMADPVFLFDLGSPYAYLAAERLDGVIGRRVRWQPVLLGGLFKRNGRRSWAAGDTADRRQGMAEVERRAAAYGLPPVRWPEAWPGNYLYAMRAAIAALAMGRGAEFARAAFRLAFVDGCELSDPVYVLRAGQAAGLDPAEVEHAVADPAVKRDLRTATDRAHERGVIGVPTLIVGEELFWGDDRLEEATTALTRGEDARA